jgi:hypothetical protein
MDIETFVKESLVAIASGVKGANKALNDAAGGPNRNTFFVMNQASNTVGNRPTTFDFDLAVTATKEGAGGGGGKINLAIAEVSLDGKAKLTQESVSRIKFSVKIDTPIGQ